MPWVSKQYIYIFLLAFIRQTSHWNGTLPSWCYCCCCCCCFCYCYRLLRDCTVDSLKSWYTLPWNPCGFLPPGNPGGKRKRFVANNIWVSTFQHPSQLNLNRDHYSWTMCGFKRIHAQSWLYPVWAFSIDKEGWHNPEICITCNPTDVKRLWVSLRVSSCRYRTIIYTTGIAPGTFKPGLGNDKSPTNCDKWKYVSWILDIWKWSKREVVKEESLVVAIYY